MWRLSPKWSQGASLFGRSLQQGYYTTTVLRIKVAQGRKEKSKPAALKPKAAAPGRPEKSSVALYYGVCYGRGSPGRGVRAKSFRCKMLETPQGRSSVIE